MEKIKRGERALFGEGETEEVERKELPSGSSKEKNREIKKERGRERLMRKGEKKEGKQGS